MKEFYLLILLYFLIFYFSQLQRFHQGKTLVIKFQIMVCWRNAVQCISMITSHSVIFCYAMTHVTMYLDSRGKWSWMRRDGTNYNGSGNIISSITLTPSQRVLSLVSSPRVLIGPPLFLVKTHDVLWCKLAHGFMVYTERAPRRQRFHVAPAM